jgi:hypothetical protein
MRQRCERWSRTPRSIVEAIGAFTWSRHRALLACRRGQHLQVIGRNRRGYCASPAYRTCRDSRPRVPEQYPIGVLAQRWRESGRLRTTLWTTAIDTRRMCGLGPAATTASSPAMCECIGLASAAPGGTSCLPVSACALSSRGSSRTGQRRPCSSGLPGCSRGCRARSSRTSCGG